MVRDVGNLFSVFPTVLKMFCENLGGLTSL